MLEAGAGILGIAFLLKAGMWPLCFWLPTTYAAATPPVASIFAIMTKVGAYIVLRLWLLLFGDDAGASAQFGGEWLLFGGMATVAFGAIGTLPRRTWRGSPPFRCSCPPERCSPPSEWGRSASRAERSSTWSARRLASARSSS